MSSRKYAIKVASDKVEETAAIHSKDGATLVDSHASFNDPNKVELIFERKDRRQGLME